MTDISEQEIDLRPYIEALIDKWYWILGLGILAAVAAYGASQLITPTYEATALVAITEPRQRVQFDPRIQTVSDNQPLEAYPDLALSDELLSELLDQINDDYGMTLSALREKLTATSGSDSTILKLTAKDENPIEAADLTNMWAELFVKWANQIYGDQGDEQLLFFEEQLDEAGKNLEESEQALIDFQANNRSSILENEILALQQTQADYLAKQRQAKLILQDIESLSAQPNNSGQENFDQLASLLLQIRTFGGVANNVESTMPWQIQLNVDGKSNLTRSDQQAILSSLGETLLEQSDQLADALDEIEPQILAVQQQKQEANAEENRLNRDFEVVEETYLTISRTVDEKRITSQDTTSGLILASKTAVPEEPTGPSSVLLAIGAGLFGMILATILIVLVTWWHGK
jgi:uncharacterized protein involved in exopolysaccharide biosynthesis